MKAKIERDGCISCGLCAVNCPNVFRMAEDGYAEVYTDTVQASDEADALEAQNNCPVSVISIE